MFEIRNFEWQFDPDRSSIDTFCQLSLTPRGTTPSWQPGTVDRRSSCGPTSTWWPRWREAITTPRPRRTLAIKYILPPLDAKP